MRTLYCKSEASFLDLLAPMFAELDSLYWVVACQMGPVKSEWIVAHEQAYEEFHIPVPAFERIGASLWRPGSLSQVRDALYFDEWSYFVGFQATKAEAVDRAARFGLSRFFSPEFYDLLTQEGQLFAVQVEGWWEFCPATDALFSRIKAFTPCREIAPRSPGAVDWTPQFV